MPEAPELPLVPELLPTVPFAPEVPVDASAPNVVAASSEVPPPLLPSPAPSSELQPTTSANEPPATTAQIPRNLIRPGEHDCQSRARSFWAPNG